MNSSIKDVLRFGPTPLDELTSRVPQDYTEVALEINELKKNDMVTITRAGELLDAVTVDHPALGVSNNEESPLIQLSSKGLQSFLR